MEKKGIVMLVLRRKVGEKIVIDGNIHISVLAIEGERVKLGVVAPPHIPILREELLRIKPGPGSQHRQEDSDAANQCTGALGNQNSS